MPRPSVVHVTALLTVVALFVLVAAGPARAAAPRSPAGSVRYRPPLPGPVVEHFDPPAHPWSAGNRGVDYSPQVGASVVAAADGEVVFAGDVAGTLHVTVLHADGLRTSYSFLAEVSVVARQQVHAGDVVGVAGGPVHFGVRDPDGTYLDPEALLAGTLAPHVVLVPGAEEGLDPLAERRSLLEVVLGAGLGGATAVTDAARARAVLLAHDAWVLSPQARFQRGIEAVARWYAERDRCTPASVAAPKVPGRRIAILVSGLGTGSDGNSAWEIRTDELGYAETVRFSYAGGRSPDPGEPGGTAAGARQVSGSPGGPTTGGAAIPVTRFDAADTQQPLTISADRLAELLARVAEAEPGVPIDVLAHSQGGVVARLAVTRAGERGALPGTVRTLVTLGSPHGGAPLATATALARTDPGGRGALELARALDPGVVEGLDDRLPSITEMAETSSVIDSVHDQPVPDGVRFVSLGARGDLTVPAGSTVDAAAVNRTLPLPLRLSTHGALPSSDAATREIALAVSGMGPTCQGLLDVAADVVVADTVARAETAAALGLDGGASLVPGLAGVGLGSG